LREVVHIRSGVICLCLGPIDIDLCAMSRDRLHRIILNLPVPKSDLGLLIVQLLGLRSPPAPQADSAPDLGGMPVGGRFPSGGIRFLIHKAFGADRSFIEIELNRHRPVILGR
jgi:hypothetical protein